MFPRITNTPRDYAWGSSTAIADFLGRTPGGGPEAELWLGAHTGSPSVITDPVPAHANLAEWIADFEKLDIKSDVRPMIMKENALRPQGLA